MGGSTAFSIRAPTRTGRTSHTGTAPNHNHAPPAPQNAIRAPTEQAHIAQTGAHPTRMRLHTPKNQFDPFLGLAAGFQPAVKRTTTTFVLPRPLATPVWVGARPADAWAP